MKLENEPGIPEVGELIEDISDGEIDLTTKPKKISRLNEKIKLAKMEIQDMEKQGKELPKAAVEFKNGNRTTRRNIAKQLKPKR